jgi:hypothetical protein
MLKPTNKTLALIAIALVGIAAVAFIFLRPANQEVSTPSPKPSVTPSPLLSAEDSALLKRLSTELVVKFNTYQRPDEPVYLQSIKPYLDAAFYEKTAAEINRYRGRLTHVKPSSADTQEPVLKPDSPTEVIVSVPVTIRAGARSEKTTAEIKWEKRGQRWVALYILNSTSGQNESKFSGGQGG